MLKKKVPYQQLCSRCGKHSKQ